MLYINHYHYNRGLCWDLFSWLSSLSSSNTVSTAFLNSHRFPLRLSLTGFDAGNKQGLAFSKLTTPSMPIAFAARASIAMLGLMTRVYFDPAIGIGKHTIADGGMASSQPTDQIRQRIAEPIMLDINVK